MRAHFYDLDELYGNTLKEFCRKNSIKYSYTKKNDIVYAEFTLEFNDSLIVLSDYNGITVSIKATSHEYNGITVLIKETSHEVSIPLNKFYYIEMF